MGRPAEIGCCPAKGWDARVHPCAHVLLTTLTAVALRQRLGRRVVGRDTMENLVGLGVARQNRAHGRLPIGG